MKIKAEVRDGVTVLDLRGRWVTAPVMERMVNIASQHSFASNCNIALSADGILIKFNPGTYHKVQDLLIEYVQDHLYPVIGRAFTEINVNPYIVPNNKDENGGGLLMMIAEETGCDVNYGSWSTPVTFHPSTSTQYNEVIDLLDTFELKYN